MSLKNANIKPDTVKLSQQIGRRTQQQQTLNKIAAQHCSATTLNITIIFSKHAVRQCTKTVLRALHKAAAAFCKAAVRKHPVSRANK